MAKVQHYFKKTLCFKAFLDHSDQRQCFRTIFLRSSSHIGSLCSTFASPCRFRSTHFAPNTLFASVNSVSLIMSKPRVALKCRFNPNLRLLNVLFE